MKRIRVRGILRWLISFLLYLVSVSAFHAVAKNRTVTDEAEEHSLFDSGTHTYPLPPLPDPLELELHEKLAGVLRRQKEGDPRPPVFLFPGLAASRLVAWRKKVCRGPSINVMDTVWLNVQKVFETLLFDSTCWVDCLTLGPNQADPPDCKVRADEGLDAISVLAPGPIIGSRTSIYAWLIDYLADSLGYDPLSIIGFPYDWRLSPGMMERRDSFYSSAKSRMEIAVKYNKRPGIVVAHSMGNNAFHYFLAWLELKDPSGWEKWVKEHIWCYVALAPPLLGAVGPLRGTVSGEGMHLQITEAQARQMEVSFGSTLWVHPKSAILDGNSADWPGKNEGDGSGWHNDLLTVKGVGGGKAQVQFGVEDCDNGELLKWMGGFYQDDGFRNAYKDLKNEYWHADINPRAKAQGRPPIRHVIVAYGVNISTEHGYVYLNDKTQKGPILDEILSEEPGGVYASKHMSWSGFDSIRLGGIGAKANAENRRLIRPNPRGKSGDGVISYLSMAYAHTWAQGHNVTYTRKEGPIIEAQASKFIDTWAPTALRDKLLGEKLPATDMYHSRNEETGEETTILEVEGVIHSHITRHQFTLTQVFEQVLHKMDQDMCLEGPGTNTGGGGGSTKGSNEPPKDSCRHTPIDLFQQARSRKQGVLDTIKGAIGKKIKSVPAGLRNLVDVKMPSIISKEGGERRRKEQQQHDKNTKLRDIIDDDTIDLDAIPDQHREVRGDDSL